MLDSRVPSVGDKPLTAMATSGIAPKRRRLSPGCLLLPVLLCLTWLVARGQRQNSFVQGVSWKWHGPTKGHLRERSGQNCQALSRKEEDVDGEARKLTSNLKQATSAQKLREILDEAVDDPIFNFIHASAAYTQLVTFKRRGCLQQEDWDSPVLLRLHSRVEDMVLKGQLGARQTANVLWSIAQLFDRFSIPIQLLAALVKSVPSEVRGMVPQALANCLWACAKLMDVEPMVLEMVPAIVAQIPEESQGHGRTRIVQLALGICAAQEGCPCGFGGSAGHCAPNPQQSNGHEHASIVQLPLGICAAQG